MWNVDNYNGSLRVFRENFTATGTGPSGAVKLTISDSGAFDVTGTGAFHDPSSYSSYVQIRHS